MIRTTLVAAALVACPSVTLAAARFGVSSTSRSKVGDGSGYDMPLYGGGRHSLAKIGNLVFVGYTSSYGWLTNGRGDAVLIGVSVDGGANWLKNQVVSKGTNDGYAAPLAVGPHPTNPDWYRLHVAWVGYDQALGWQAYYAYADVNPAAVVYPVQSTSTPAAVGAIGGGSAGNVSIAADAIGGVHISYTGPVDGSGASPVLYSHSSTYGAIFEEIGTLVANSSTLGCASPWNVQFPSMSATPAGDVFVGVSACYFGVARRLAGAGSFSAPAILPINDGGEPSVVATDANHAYFASAYQSSFWVASTSNGGLSTSDWSVSYGPAVAGGGYAFSASLAVDSAGGIAVAWVNLPSQGYFSRSTNGSGGWSSPAIFATSLGSDMWDPSLVIDSSFKANIAFDDMGVVFFTKEQ